jgi:hypothetical protein
LRNAHELRQFRLVHPEGGADGFDVELIVHAHYYGKSVEQCQTDFP